MAKVCALESQFAQNQAGKLGSPRHLVSGRRYGGAQGLEVLAAWHQGPSWTRSESHRGTGTGATGNSGWSLAETAGQKRCGQKV